jgi:molybdate transport system ATP-binding protein
MSLEFSASVTRGSFSLSLEMSVAAGETLALVGRNGTGKSTVLSCIAGLLPITSGQISVDGTVINAPGAHVFVQPEHRNIGMVFQRLHLLPHLSALGNVEFALKMRGADTIEARQWLSRLQIEHVADQKVSTLSGGEAQRVALARALAPQPRVLLLDEPLSAVDADSRSELRKTIAACLEEFGGIAVLVSHDSDDVSLLATSVQALRTP